MTSWAEVEALALSWPETTSTPSYGGFPALRVNKKLFAHEAEHGPLPDPPRVT